MALTIPQYEDYLRSLGIGDANESGARYSGDQRYSQGQLSELMGDPIQAYQLQQLRGQGYIEMPRDSDAQWFNQRYGMNFKSGEDYAKWLYGGGSVEQGPDGQTYFKTPNGADNYVNRPLDYDAPDSALGNLVLAGLGGLAGGAFLGPALSGVGGLSSGITTGAATGFGAGAIGGITEGDLSAALKGGLMGGLTGAAAGGLMDATGLSDYLGNLTGGDVQATGQSTVPDLQQTINTPNQPFDFQEYLKTGSINGAPANPTPTIPGVGNGVGLTEAAMALGTPAASTVAGRIFDGDASSSDWLSALGTVGATGLGLAGANAQSDAFKDVYNQQTAIGQPYRDKLLASYQPGFSMADQPDFMNSLNIGADAAARATSAKVGNPVDNPGAYAEMQKYISGNLALPALQNYRGQLGQFGGFGLNTAGAASMNQAQSQGGTYNALGYGLGQLTQPESPFKGLLSQFGKNNNLFSF